MCQIQSFWGWAVIRESRVLPTGIWIWINLGIMLKCRFWFSSSAGVGAGILHCKPLGEQCWCLCGHTWSRENPGCCTAWPVSGVFPQTQQQQAFWGHTFPGGLVCVFKRHYSCRKINQAPHLCPCAEVCPGPLWRESLFLFHLPTPPLPAAPQSVMLFFEFELKPFQTYF